MFSRTVRRPASALLFSLPLAFLIAASVAQPHGAPTTRASGPLLKLRRYLGLPSPSFSVTHHLLTSTTEPINFDVASKIDDSQKRLTVELKPGQILQAQSDVLISKSANVDREMKTYRGCGFWSHCVPPAYIDTLKNTGKTSCQVTLGALDYPENIVSVNMADFKGGLTVEQARFVCAPDTVDSIALKVFPNRLYEPWVLQKMKRSGDVLFDQHGFWYFWQMKGSGDVFLKVSGEIHRSELKDGEELRVARDALVGFSASMDFRIESDVMNGIEKVSLATLVGPWVVLQQDFMSRERIRRRREIMCKSENSENSEELDGNLMTLIGPGVVLQHDVMSRERIRRRELCKSENSVLKFLSTSLLIGYVSLALGTGWALLLLFLFLVF